ncbi:MAG TPA: hypothetical protein V6C99_05170 [Oculatellaceae cyanobacterium]
MQTHHFFKNTGGMNQKNNELSLGADEAEDIVNLHATAEGSWSNRDIGYLHLNATPLADGKTITGLHQYEMLTGDLHLIAAAGASLYKVDPDTGQASVIANGLSEANAVSFVTFNGLLIACNGLNPPKKWDGENPAANLDGWPPAIAGVSVGNPSISEIYSNRLVFAGDAQNPSMLFISEQENPQNFTPDGSVTSAGAIQVSPGDGEKITALKTLFLPLSNEEVLVVFKQRSTYILSGSNSETFALQKISGEFGAVSHQSVVQVGGEMMFLSNEGITSLSTATLQGNLVSGFLSERIQAQIERLNRSALSGAFAVHLRDRREVWWCVPEGSTPQNQVVLVYNYGSGRGGAWSRRTGIQAACGAAFAGRLLTGGYDGHIQQQLRGNSYQGTPIPWRYRTGFQDFSSPRLRKRIRDVELYLKQISTMPLTVHMQWDFNRSSVYQQTRTFVVAPDKASCIYGSARFGQDFYNQSGTSSLRFTPSGSGRAFQMELQGETMNNPVEIEGWSITTIPGGLR